MKRFGIIVINAVSLPYEVSFDGVDIEELLEKSKDLTKDNVLAAPVMVIDYEERKMKRIARNAVGDFYLSDTGDKLMGKFTPPEVIHECEDEIAKEAEE